MRLGSFMVYDYFCHDEKGDATTMLTYGDSTSQIPNDLSKLTARLRQQPPFRYVDEVIHIDREQRSMRGRLALCASGSMQRYGTDEAESLPNFLIFEALAQLSGLLIRCLGLVAAGQVGYLISVSEGSLMQDRYPPVSLLLHTQLTAQIGNILQFTCSVTGDGLEEDRFKLEIGVS